MRRARKMHGALDARITGIHTNGEAKVKYTCVLKAIIRWVVRTYQVSYMPGSVPTITTYAAKGRLPMSQSYVCGE